MSVKLTDAHLVMLSAAAQRKDRCLTAPDKMKGAILAKVSAKLVKVGLVREGRAKAGAPVWRRDNAGQSYLLKLTAAGLKAIAVDDVSDEAIAPREAPQPQSNPVGASASADPDDTGEVAATVTPRAGSKLARVIRRPSFRFCNSFFLLGYDDRSLIARGHTNRGRNQFQLITTIREFLPKLRNPVTAPRKATFSSRDMQRIDCSEVCKTSYKRRRGFGTKRRRVLARQKANLVFATIRRFQRRHGLAVARDCCRFELPHLPFDQYRRPAHPRLSYRQKVGSMPLAVLLARLIFA
jgi:hypothetical protein